MLHRQVRMNRFTFISKFMTPSNATLGWIATLAVFSVAASSPSIAAPPDVVADAGEPRVQLDVVYDADYDLKLDFALPPSAADAPRPAIMLIHGGAWRSGDKSNLRGQMIELANRGYVACSVQYRFCPEHVFPAQVDDVKHAVQFLRDEADRFGIDPTRIGAMGISAGAHLAMMLAVTDEVDDFAADRDSDTSSKVQVAVAYFGPAVLRPDAVPGPARRLLEDFVGGPLDEHVEELRRASPMEYLDDQDAPLLLFQGTADPLVTMDQAVEMSRAMGKAGMKGRAELLVGQNHGWGGELLEYTNRDAVEMFDRWLSTGTDR